MESNIIAAIDFGTAFTGFAYLFSTDTDNIFTAVHGTILPADRVPTVIMLNPDNSVNSFGINAEDAYAIEMADKKGEGYRLFREFKLALYNGNEKVNSALTVYDTENKPMKAMDLFSIVIKYLKQLVFESIMTSKICKPFDFEDKITWMLTIPAISSDSARQLMREAAVLAGIDKTRLRLVLEPEAAAINCKGNLLCATPGANLTSYKSKYILADLGGGTADFCVHEILIDGNIRELHRSVGDTLGGSNVNSEFLQFLIKLFGNHVVNEFKSKQYLGYLTLTRAFEELKRKFDPEKKCIIDIPRALIEMGAEESGNSLKVKLSKSEYSSSVRLCGKKDKREIQTKLLCDSTIIESFFQPTLNGIIKQLNEISTDCREDNIDTLFVVGGFSQSEYIRREISRKTSIKNIVNVPEPCIAVLKGAVKMGLTSVGVIERRARYTYGFSIALPFKEGEHPAYLKFEREGKYLCNQIFSKLFEKGTLLKVGDRYAVTTEGKLPTLKDMEGIVLLYSSLEKNPKFCLEENKCTKVGKIIVKPPENGWPGRYEIDMILIVGETEFTVKAVNKINGKELEVMVDFL